MDGPLDGASNDQAARRPRLLYVGARALAASALDGRARSVAAHTEVAALSPRLVSIDVNPALVHTLRSLVQLRSQRAFAGSSDDKPLALLQALLKIRRPGRTGDPFITSKVHGGRRPFMTANKRARNPCKPGKAGLYGRDGRNAPKVNLVDAEWTSGSWSSVPASRNR
jgi:hypothetical protein